MCQLLGLVGIPPLSIKETLREFCALDDSSVHSTAPIEGWGLSGFNQGRAVYYARSTKAVSADQEGVDAAVSKTQKSPSPILIVHKRKGSSGVSQINNTHPFHWRDWVFAHTGTLFNPEDLKLEEAKPQGDTDSERFGLWLIERMLPALDPTTALVQLIKEVRPKLHFSSLTFLLSDGKTLWAYRDVNDEDLQKGENLSQREKIFSLHTANVGNMQIVSSEPLPAQGTAWSSIPQKTIAIFVPGRSVQLHTV